MATRILGPTGSRRRRRLLILGPIALLFALLLPTLVFASAVPPPGAPNDPTFEFDGNLLTEALQPGTLDWANPGNVTDHAAVITNAVRNANGSCSGTSTNPANFTLGGPNVVGQGLLVCDGTISKQTPNDANGFTQGQHEDEGENPINWVVKAVSSPKKTDLSEVYIYGKVFDSPFDPDLLANNLMFIFDAGRLDTNGSFHVDFEMNQAAQTNCGDADQFTFCQPRTENDVLVSYDSVGGLAAPVATVFLWKTELDAGESCESSQGDVNSPTLGGCYVLLDSPPAMDGFQAAQGVFNTTEIDAAPWKAVVCDTTSIENSSQCTIRSKIPAGGNMEGYIDIEGFVPDFTLCPGFGQISAKSRSSAGINASLQDTTGALPVDASICGSIIVKKVDGDANALPGASFTFDPDPADRVGTVEIADGGTGDAADGDNGYVCVNDALFGSYNITETGVPAGYFGDADTETVSVTDPSTCADRLDEDGVPVDPDDVDATFENLKGSILITKEDGGGNPLAGAEFTITPSPVTGADSLDVTDGETGVDQADGSDGVICVDDVFIVDNAATDYDIVEKTAPPGWFKDGDTVTVTVASPSTCADRLAEDPIVPDATFTNEKGSIIIRKEAKDARTAATDDLFGGATFTISPNPLTGAASSSLDVTDDQVAPPAPTDQFATDGLICIDGVVDLGAGNSFSIVEKNSNNSAYRKDGDTETVAVSSASTCAERTTSDSPDALFVNTPLSKITVTFESLAGAGVTVASIECPPEAADPTPDPTPDPAVLDDTSEAFTDLVPGTYNCTVVIDP
jgi:Prealbumin-like fold domain